MTKLSLVTTVLPIRRTSCFVFLLLIDASRVCCAYFMRLDTSRICCPVFARLRAFVVMRMRCYLGDQRAEMESLEKSRQRMVYQEEQQDLIPCGRCFAKFILDNAAERVTA